ncbi:unnamed protein product, partial [Mesorhabditis spiculigera]
MTEPSSAQPEASPSCCNVTANGSAHHEDEEKLPERKTEVKFADLEQPSCSNTPKKSSILRGFFSRSGRWKVFGDRKTDPGVMHTTGLILEERPSNLPQKSEEESARHRLLYEQMLEQAKKKDVKLEKERRKAHEDKKKAEEALAIISRTWNEEILPNWNSSFDTRKCRDLWWKGLPSKVRGKVWQLAIGNALNVSEELYNICCERAELRLNGIQETGETKEARYNREASVAQIQLDVSRTFPALGIFQEGGPYQHLLTKLLGAYACYRPDVGYVQSMSFIAAIFLLQMEPFPAFVAFSNLMNQPLQLAFFRLNKSQMTEYFVAFDLYFHQELPELHAHFDAMNLRPDIYIIDWVYTAFAKSLSLDVTCRVWDVFFRDGEEFLFKTALGILKMHEDLLLDMEFDVAVGFLRKLPADITGNELFRNIEVFMKTGGGAENGKGKKRFQQLHLEVHERLTSINGNKIDKSTIQEISEGLDGMKMSKSLSVFLADLLEGQ